ncbi:MAG: NAD-dependent epimerase/dehydratase family protein [bacterium]
MRVLVTGGGGFLGSAICKSLAARKDQVISYSRGRHSHLQSFQVQHIQGDITDRRSLKKAAEGCDAVIHTAAKAGVWGSYQSFYRPNVVGTQNVISVCRDLSIRKLVVTSSPSVVFDGKDMEGVDETAPYPALWHAPYPATKAQAEKAALAANDAYLAVTVLRPHLIWGPGDPHLVKRIVERGKSGKLKRIGTADKHIDSIYIDNAADAHVLALDRLEPGSPCAGKVYFISNGEPVETWWLINAILKAHNVSPVNKTMPVPLAFAAAGVMEMIWKSFRIRSEPLLTRFVVKELTTSHWFDISAAERDLGYRPLVTLAEGLRRLSVSSEVI